MLPVSIIIQRGYPDGAAGGPVWKRLVLAQTDSGQLQAFPPVFQLPGMAGEELMVVVAQDRHRGDAAAGGFQPVRRARDVGGPVHSVSQKQDEIRFFAFHDCFDSFGGDTAEHDMEIGKNRDAQPGCLGPRVPDNLEPGGFKAHICDKQQKKNGKDGWQHAVIPFHGVDLV